MRVRSVPRAPSCPASTAVISVCISCATPLVNEYIDEDGVERALDQAVEGGGWLIFYGHDVVASPSPDGCTPKLMRHALKASTQRKLPIVTVAEALRRASG